MPPRAVATSTQVFSGAGGFAGDTRISWFSSDGTAAVSTIEDPAGQIVSTERVEYTRHQGVRTIA